MDVFTAFVTIFAAAVLGVLACVIAYVLGWASQALEVHIDAKQDAILAALPGANCGGCGYPNCSEYAKAVRNRQAEVNLCVPGGPLCAQKLAEIMEVEVSDTGPYQAVVHCAAHEDQRLQRAEYRGETTCAAANLVPHVQGCVYGCLGFGDCVRACKFDAIHIVRGLATVDYKKCIGCKACMLACPRGIISMVPFKGERMLVVACSNRDFGHEVKSVCTQGCLGCKACTRDNGVIEMDGNLPVISYDRYDPQADYERIRQKCPTAVLMFEGKPAQLEPANNDIGMRPYRFQPGVTIGRTDDSTTSTPA